RPAVPDSRRIARRSETAKARYRIGSDGANSCAGSGKSQADLGQCCGPGVVSCCGSWFLLLASRYACLHYAVATDHRLSGFGSAAVVLERWAHADLYSRAGGLCYVGTNL